MNPLGLGVCAAAVTPLGDDEPFMIRRWMLVLGVPIIAAIVGFGWRLEARVTKIEAAPFSTAEQYRYMDQRLVAVEKIISMYEELRMQRERQITELQTERRNMERKIDEMNAKLDRLLYGRSR